MKLNISKAVITFSYFTEDCCLGFDILRAKRDLISGCK